MPKGTELRKAETSLGVGSVHSVLTRTSMEPEFHSQNLYFKESAKADMLVVPAVRKQRQTDLWNSLSCLPATKILQVRTPDSNNNR